MSAENVEIVRELMALRERARESGEPLTHADLAAPDFEIDMSRRVFNPAVYRGLDGLARLDDEIRDVCGRRFASCPSNSSTPATAPTQAPRRLRGHDRPRPPLRSLRQTSGARPDRTPPRPRSAARRAHETMSAGARADHARVRSDCGVAGRRVKSRTVRPDSVRAGRIAPEAESC